MEEQAKKSPEKSQGRGHTTEIALIVLAAFAVACVLVSALALKYPVVPVILIVLIEVAMAFFMQRVPLWIHGIIVAAEIVLGVLTGHVVCLLLCGALYFFSVLAIGIVLYGQKKSKAHPA